MDLERIFYLVFLIIPLSSFAQKEANIWYFGNQAGIDFNYSPPKVLLDGSVYSWEGSAVIADENGKLLFYTDGETVFNKNHQLMENGSNLGGHLSARQTAVIFPKPASSDIYYVFTVDAFHDSGVSQTGLAYSVVDIKANGGLGKVTEKGVQLQARSAESLSVIASCKDGNDQEYWAIAANYDEKGKVFAYHIDKNGVDKNPVISSFNVKGELIQYIKFSPAGDKVMLIDQSHRDRPQTKVTQLIIADFDFSTGKINNPQYLEVTQSMHFNQAEFSPDGKLLYYSSGSKIHQLDLKSRPYKIIATHETPTDHVSEFQLGPDGNIYIATGGVGYLSAIINPNELGLEGKYIEKYIYLEGRSSGMGLPSFVRSYLYNGLPVDAGKDSIICSSQPLPVGMQAQLGVSYQWYPSTHLSSANVANPVFRFHNTGNDVQELEYILTATNEHCSKKDTVNIKVYPAPPEKIRGSRSVCPGETLSNKLP